MSLSVSVIESRQNQRYKQWQKYVSHPEKEECPWIPVEGWKQVRDLASERPVELLLFSDPEDPRLKLLLPRSRESFCLSPRLLQRLSTVEFSQGVLAFFQKPFWRWQDLTPWVLYLYRLQDPGNLGTLFRTARATGMFSLVTSPKTVSCFNSKVARASVGSLFAVPFLEGITAGGLKRHGYRLWAATPEGGKPLFEVHFEPPTAVLIGNEGGGLEASVLALTEKKIHIPMQPQAESLNASVAGSLILYEVLRQGSGHG